MCPQSDEHKTIKEIVLQKLEDLYGSGLTEYADSGQIDDVYVITPEGVEIFAEIVWTASKYQFDKDLIILHNSPAHVKILIVNPNILQKKTFLREFTKTKYSQMRAGKKISDMIDGQLILNSPKFRDIQFPKIVERLVKKCLDERPIIVSPDIITINQSNWTTHSTLKVYNKSEEPYYQVQVMLTIEDPSLSSDAIKIEPEKPQTISSTTVEPISILNLMIMHFKSDKGLSSICLNIFSINPKQTITFLLTATGSNTKLVNIRTKVARFSKEQTQIISKKIQKGFI